MKRKRSSGPPFSQNQWWTFLGCISKSNLDVPRDVLKYIYYFYPPKCTRNCPIKQCNFRTNQISMPIMVTHLDEYHNTTFSRLYKIKECLHLGDTRRLVLKRWVYHTCFKCGKIMSCSGGSKSYKS